MDIPATMKAMVLTRHGGMDAYEWQQGQGIVEAMHRNAIDLMR